MMRIARYAPRYAVRSAPCRGPIGYCVKPSRPRLARSLLIAMITSISACTVVGPDYQRPANRLPERYTIDHKLDGARSVDPELGRWWSAYRDPHLNGLVEDALAHNGDIQIAVARVQEADALAREVGAALLPAVNLAGSAGRGRARNIAAPGGSYLANMLQLSALSTYEIDFWGRLARASEAARAQAMASREAADVVRLTVAGLVAQAWFGLRALDEQAKLATETLQARDEQLRLLTLRVDAGAAPVLELEQARGARADASLQLTELERQRALAQTLLGRLTGQPGLSFTPARSSEWLSQMPIPPEPPAGLPSALLDRRPDLRQAEQQLIAANAQIGVARAAMLPSIALTGSLGAQSLALGSLLDDGARIWSLGFGLSLPIFDGGRLQARTDQAIARERQALASYQSAAQSAFREVSDALIASDSARRQQADIAIRASAAHRALELARLRHEAGYSAYLEVLDAQRSLNAAQQEIVRNRLARLSASVDLFKALSGGWSDPGGATSVSATVNKDSTTREPQ